MVAYLFGWNPKQMNPSSLSDEISQVARRGYASIRWRTGNRRNLPANSRAFLIRLGSEPRGIVGAGWTVGEPDDDQSVEIRFDALNEIPFIPFATLEAPPFNGLRWSIQASGIEIPGSIADELDATLSYEERFALDPDTSIWPFQEGSQRLRQHLATERNREAADEKRADTLRRTGTLACEVCDFDFVRVYGQRGEGFCEVHHLLPFGQSPGPRETRLNELAVLCSNCHRMIHRSPAVAISQLRLAVRQATALPE